MSWGEPQWGADTTSRLMWQGDRPVTRTTVGSWVTLWRGVLAGSLPGDRGKLITQDTLAVRELRGQIPSLTLLLSSPLLLASTWLKPTRSQGQGGGLMDPT